MQLFLTFSQHILVVRKFLDPLILLVTSSYHSNQNIVVVRKMSNSLIFLLLLLQILLFGYHSYITSLVVDLINFPFMI